MEAAKMPPFLDRKTHIDKNNQERQEGGSLQMAYRAITFDLVGVILDSDQLHAAAALIVASNAGIRLTQDDYERLHGTSFETFFASLCARESRNTQSRGEAQATAREAYAEYCALVKKHAKLYDGAIDALMTARTLFSAVALTTSMEWPIVEVVFRKFRRERLLHYFDCVISGSHVCLPKPFPEAYLVTAQYLGIRPKEMLAVEDSFLGIRAARLAGMTTIGIATKHSAQKLVASTRPRCADYAVNDHDGLVQLLLSIDSYGGNC